MLSKLSTRQIGLLLVLVPVAIELVFVAAVAMELLDAARYLQRVHHVKNTLIKLNDMQYLTIETFFYLTEPKRKSRKERQGALNEFLKTFEQTENWGTISKESNPELADVLERTLELRKAAITLGKSALITADVTRDERNMTATTAMETQKLNEDVVRIESNLIRKEPGELANLQFRIIALVFISLLLNLIVCILLYKVIIGNLNSSVKLVVERARLLALGQPLSKGLSGKNELSELDRVITQASNVLTQFRWTESAILDNAADVICSLDEKMRFQTVGESSSKVWGQSPEVLVRKSIMTLVTKDTAEFTRTSLQNIRDSAGTGKFENALHTKDGSVRDALWTVTWSNEKQSYYCVVNDVSDMLAVERMKKRFMAMVSHDLRSPMSSIAIILTSVAARNREEMTDGAFREIERANGNSQRLLALVNDFLELEKLEAHKFSLDLAPTAASEVCNLAKDSIAGMAQHANVSIKGPRGDAIVLADERRLVQVLINLLSNAVKFSPKGSTISIEIESIPNEAIIKVSDEGPGIAKEEQQIIFDKFQQTRSKSNVNVKGTGLGLAIVKNIVEAHNGRVGVTCEGAVGSTFWISIPRWKGEMESENLL